MLKEDSLDEAAITRHISTELPGVDVVVASRDGGGLVRGEFDFAAPNKLIPHPVYGRNHWVNCPGFDGG